MCADFKSPGREKMTVNSLKENQTEMGSFSIEIWKCDRKANSQCKGDEDVRRFLREAKFSLYIQQGTINFKNNDPKQIIEK
jgi:tRNA U34 2-thiouridine synthase MnmA/TrmU